MLAKGKGVLTSGRIRRHPAGGVFLRSLTTLVVLAALLPEPIEESITKAVQATTGRRIDHDLKERDDEAELPAWPAVQPGSTLLPLGGPKGGGSRPNRVPRTTPLQTHHRSILFHIFAFTTPQLIPLRL